MQVYQNTASSMGTRFNLLLPGIDKFECDQRFSSCLQELNRLENMLSCFIPTSEISFLNDQAFNAPIKVSDELFTILNSCLTYYELTEKTFDISLGKIIDNQERILIEEIGADKVLFNDKDKTVQFASAQIKLNLGGFGKGYALLKIRNLLIKLGVSSAFISFGESSICCIGKHPYGDYWLVGIQDFYHKDKSIDTLKLVDQSVSTSGNMKVNDHIINPANGKVVTAKKLITVKCNSPLDAEVLSTAFMIADNLQKVKILEAFSGLEILEVTYNNQIAEISKYKSQ